VKHDDGTFDVMGPIAHSNLNITER
jgi:hypothetical protein